MDLTLGWSLIAFVPAALALNLTPGADMLFCVAQGARNGPRAAVAASAGISTGSMVHVTLAGLGLGALIARFPVALDLIRWLGAAYLLWLAWKTLTTPIGGDPSGGKAASRPFRDGVVVNLTNPKVILFVLAFIPQFVVPGHGILGQFLLFGAILAVGGFLVNSVVGIFAGQFGRRLARNATLAKVLRGVIATIFGGLAIRLALTAQRS